MIVFLLLQIWQRAPQESCDDYQVRLQQVVEFRCTGAAVTLWERWGADPFPVVNCFGSKVFGGSIGRSIRPYFSEHEHGCNSLIFSDGFDSGDTARWYQH